MNIENFDFLKQKVLENYPNESCFFVLKNDEIIEISNLAENKTKNFTLDSIDLIKYLNKSKAFIHSHCRLDKEKLLFDLRTPSFADLINQKKMGIPWGICGTDGENVSDCVFIPRIPSSNYIGRKFLWHINDCRTIVQDYLLNEFNLNLIEKYEIRDFTNLELNPKFISNFILNFIQEENLIEITDTRKIQKGDIFIMDALPPFGKNCHIGVWTGEFILHQEKISRMDKFTSLNGRINHIYRHPALVN